MTHAIYTDRSRIEDYQRCARLRFLRYHESGTGLESASKPLPLAVGGSVHVGLATLLIGGSEDQAVAAALADFSRFQSALDLPTEESVARATAPSDTIDVVDRLHADLAGSLGMTGEEAAAAGLDGVATRVYSAGKEYDAWLWREQAALVEGLVRAYARRRLRPLLEEYEVLEVEREGEWELAPAYQHGDCPRCGIGTDNDHDGNCGICAGWDDEHVERVKAVRGYRPAIRFMSRPDALLRSRADNSLYLLSFKTAASWDIRKQRDAQHDMQGLSEGVEVEKRLALWWHTLQLESLHNPAMQDAKVADDSGNTTTVRRLADVTRKEIAAFPATIAFLRGLPAPPRILGIRYEYMLKGDRWKDRDLSARFGFDCRSQRSPLVRAYQSRTGQLNASWEFLKEDGAESKLAWQTWKSRPLWELDGDPLSVHQWIDLLDQSEETMSAYDSTTGLEPRSLGWHSAAQTTGYLSQHPLDSIFVPPLVVYRQDEDLRNWIEQVEAQERRIAEAVALVESATDEAERRSLLNVHFSQTRHACEYPTTCSMSRICWSGEDMQRDPLASGQYVRRVPNHPQERTDGASTGNSQPVQK